MTPIEVELEGRWRAFWRSIKGKGNGRKQWDIIRTCYTAPGRYYHTLHHLMHCFAWLDTYQESKPLQSYERPAAEGAVWFHDAVHIPGMPLNEACSAMLAHHLMYSGINWRRLSLDISDDITALLPEIDRGIHASQWHEPPKSGWARRAIQAFLDCDLAILGEDWQTYRRYTVQIRREYGNVPDADFTAGRLAFLRKFAERDRIYDTQFFYERLEVQARTNIAREIAQLERKLVKIRAAA